MSLYMLLKVSDITLIWNKIIKLLCKPANKNQCTTLNTLGGRSESESKECQGAP